ncbi:patatin-like phospholipase family protein [Pseudoalteromonas luteoviolacea]|uniref:PNPLA domain-containing protein n=1 Tax=Pseudoalteromonas luteoviolacea S4060-1 TaxID=1365257 RepID=A0A167PAE0_9GAMM|nr:patatin-like phospholipase family protein [Pseudoalteromonas luteoviolacea]KZN69857.1 hypothetical protein N478_10195 [Pseudoalteromonas luteoviolacea S4060-1]
MSKLTIILFVAGFMCACSNIRSVPYPTHFETLDQHAVNFIRDVPAISLKDYSPQSKRALQKMRDKEIMVSISGGGARAAAFSLGVLAELEYLGRWTTAPNDDNAVMEIDYFSTVSGGGWGAASYLADRIQSGTAKYSLNERLPDIEEKFLKFSSENDSCLTRGIEKHITTGIKLGQINTNTNSPQLPYLFINTTIEANQSPFIPSPKHINYYHVSDFYACDRGETHRVTKQGNLLPISYAVAMSGSVPGFHYSSAATNICNDPILFKSSFCSRGKNNLSDLVLVDGGVYDNYGFQSALEILNSAPSTNNKTLIVIDSNADTEIPFTNNSDPWNFSLGFGSLTKAGFPGKTSSFNRIFNMTAKAMGITPIVLDFYGAALTNEQLSRVQKLGLLEGLDILQEHAKNYVNCFAVDGSYLDTAELRSEYWSQDCTVNNFYRSGLIGKTTYKFDDYYFTLLEQLGRFVVRVNADKIHAAIYK